MATRAPNGNAQGNLEVPGDLGVAGAITNGGNINTAGSIYVGGVLISAASFGSEVLANAAGNTTLTIPVGRRQHSAVVTFSGSTRTSVVILPVTDRIAGDIVFLRLVNPADLAITEAVRNATSGGTVLRSFYSDDRNAAMIAFFNGTAWELFIDAQPVT